MKERSSPSGMHNDLTAWTEEQIMGLEVDFIHIASAEFLSAWFITYHSAHRHQMFNISIVPMCTLHLIVCVFILESFIPKS